MITPFRYGRRPKTITNLVSLRYPGLCSFLALIVFLVRRFKNSVTGETVREIPMTPGGGILADDTGLGKTLTCLALIVGSATTAKDFVGDTHGQSQQRQMVRAKSTLIVAPLSCKICNPRRDSTGTDLNG